MVSPFFSASKSSSMQFTQTYDEFIATKVAFLAGRIASGERIEDAEWTDGVEPDGQANRRLSDFALQYMTKSRWDELMRCHRVRLELGRVPRTARELLDAMVERRGLVTSYRGVISRDERPSLLDEKGRREYLTPEQIDDPAFVGCVLAAKAPITTVDLKLDLRCQAAELGLRFSRDAISDAVDAWVKDGRERSWSVICSDLIVELPQARREEAEAKLRSFVESVFTCEPSVDFVIAVLKKFVWQVKRKIARLPVTDHLMPVLLGPQGVGKSTLIEALCSPYAELTAATDFAQITDDRNIELWHNFVLVLDEMGRATRADVDIVKHVISASTLNRRPMRENSQIQVVQNATLIGSANATSLADLIRDPTGIRRFAALHVPSRPNFATLVTPDWADVWALIDHLGDDPMRPYADPLREQQEAHREKSRLEEWVEGLREAAYRKGQFVTTQDLYEYFRRFEDDLYPGMVKTHFPTFSREFAALMRSRGVKAPFESAREERARGYVFLGIRRER